MKDRRRRPYLIGLLVGLLPLVMAAIIVPLLPKGAPELAQADRAQTDAETVNEPAAKSNASLEPDAPSVEQAAASAEAAAEPAKTSFDPAQLSLQDLFEQLGDRARAGDAVAACELAHVVAECRMHQATYIRGRNSPAASATSAEVERFIEREAIRQEEKARMSRRCEAMNRIHLVEGALFTAQAGLAGHTQALIALTQLPQNAPAEFISNPQLIELYRSQLWPALRRALAAGHPLVTAAVMDQLASPMGSAVAGVVPDAYRNPQVAAALLNQMSPELHNLMMGRLYPAPSSDVLESAAVWTDELFGGRLPDVVSLEQLLRSAAPDSASTCAEPEAWLDGL